MLKKKLVTFAAAAFCVAIVTAQSTGYPTSTVKSATANLIEDGVIDSLPFGNEDGKGVIFGQFEASSANSTASTKLGWGNSLSDTLWLSVYDGFQIYGEEASTDSVTKAYGSDDTVNVQYIDERPRVYKSTAVKSVTPDANYSNDVNFTNTLAVGLAFNNVFGVQAGWYADWTNRKDVASKFDTTNGGFDSTTTPTTTDIKSDSKNSSTGKTESYSYDNIKNFTRNNKIFFNFKGAGIENDGEVPFWAKLNSVYVNLDFDEKGNDYTSSTSYLGETKTSVNANGINQTITIKPGIVGEVGFNLKEWGVVKPSVSVTEAFDITFNILNYNTSHKTTTNTVATRTETTVDYEKKAGSQLVWSNQLTPKFEMDFNLLDQLKLKTAVGVGVGVGMDNKDAGTYTRTRTAKTYTKSSGLTTSNQVTKVEGGDATNTHTFTTSVTPGINLGLVYQVVPEKANINFGVMVMPGSYTWKIKETTNSNINTVTSTETINEVGSSSTQKTLVRAGNTAEKREVIFTNEKADAYLTLGATWFFTENAKLDVYYTNNFATLFKDSNTFGVDFSVMF